jgi:hypothetical protein
MKPVIIRMNGTGQKTMNHSLMVFISIQSNVGKKAIRERLTYYDLKNNP